MGMLLAGLAGAAQGYNNLMAQQKADQDKVQAKQEEIEKERRIEEANMRISRFNGAQSMESMKAKDAYENSPEQVQRDIDIAKQKMPMLIDQKKQEYQATHPNDDLERQVLQAHANYYNKSGVGSEVGTGKLSDQDTLRIKGIDNKIEVLSKQPVNDDTEKINFNKKMNDLYRQREEILSGNYDGSVISDHDINDPAGIIRDRAIQELNDLGAAVDFNKKTSTAEIVQTLKTLKEEKAANPVQPGLINKARMTPEQSNARYLNNAQQRQLPFKVRMGLITKDEWEQQQRLQK